jgi:hypothetical protein
MQKIKHEKIVDQDGLTDSLKRNKTQDEKIGLKNLKDPLATYPMFNPSFLFALLKEILLYCFK